MENIITALKKLIDEQGKIYVALLLGHKSTRTVENWINSKEVPASKKAFLEVVLKSEGVLK